MTATPGEEGTQHALSASLSRQEETQTVPVATNFKKCVNTNEFERRRAAAERTWGRLNARCVEAAKESRLAKAEWAVEKMHPVARDGRVSKTNAGHQRYIAEVIAFAGTTSPTASDVISYLQMRHEFPRDPTLLNTSYVTVFGMGHSIKSAAKLCPSLLPAVESEEYRRALLNYEQKATAALKHIPHGITLEEMVTAVEDVKTMTTIVARYTTIYLALWWILAARQEDALLLQLRNVHLRGSALSVVLVEGKGVRICGHAMTIHTCLPPRSFLDLSTLTEDSNGYLFPPHLRKQISELALQALKRANPLAEVRGVRRGALQLLASNPETTDDCMRVFSGHKGNQQLQVYLLAGLANGGRRARGSEAGRSLMPPRK